jgi:hypothetical protein
MTRRLSSACVGAALLVALGLPGRSSAKPPDLPMNEVDTVKPQAAPQIEESAEPPTAPLGGGAIMTPPECTPPAVVPLFEVLPSSLPTPAFYQLLPTARRTFAGSLLFGIHPLLALTPTAQFLDAPFDHPQRVAGDDVFRDMPTSFLDTVEPSPPLVSVQQGDWLKWLVSHWAARHGAPPPEKHEGFVNAFEPPAGVTCPYLRRQAADRHACQMADPDVGRDVLSNLDRLEQADHLMELAEAFARAGCFGEAMECYAAVGDLCPGSPCAGRAADAVMDLFVQSCGFVHGSEEAAEGQQNQAGDKAMSWCDWLIPLAQMMGVPCPVFINVYSSDPNARIQDLINSSEDLRQIESEWERIWCTDQPSHLTPEKVDGLICGSEGPPRKAPATEEHLQRPVSVTFSNTPLRQVLDDLATVRGINIVIDEAALADQGANPDQPVTIKLEQVSLKSALNLILRQCRLCYVFKDEVLLVTTESAAHPPEIRTYPIGDLLDDDECEGEPEPKPSEPGEESLIKLIKNTVQPKSWSDMGGPGTIEYFPVAKTLVVNQTMPVHDQIGDLLAALRRDLDDEAAEEDSEAEQDLPAPEKQPEQPQPGVEEQVRGLMKACRLLMGEGLHAEAAELARQAYALDPESVMADPLVYKMHLLADRPSKRSCDSTERCEPSGQDVCPYCPAPGKPIPGVVPEEEEDPPSDEASTSPASFSLEELLGGPGRLTFGVGAGEMGLRLCAECSVGGSVYHLLFSQNCLAIWKTADDSDKPGGEGECPR